MENYDNFPVYNMLKRVAQRKLAAEILGTYATMLYTTVATETPISCPVSIQLTYHEIRDYHGNFQPPYISILLWK